jgi:hypothetical protein
VIFASLSSWMRRAYRRRILAADREAKTAIGRRLDRLALRWIGPRAVSETDAHYRERLLDHLKMRWLHS